MKSVLSVYMGRRAVPPHQKILEFYTMKCCIFVHFYALLNKLKS